MPTRCSDCSALFLWSRQGIPETSSPTSCCHNLYFLVTHTFLPSYPPQLCATLRPSPPDTGGGGGLLGGVEILVGKGWLHQQRSCQQLILVSFSLLCLCSSQIPAQQNSLLSGQPFLCYPNVPTTCQLAGARVEWADGGEGAREGLVLNVDLPQAPTVYFAPSFLLFLFYVKYLGGYSVLVHTKPPHSL